MPQTLEQARATFALKKVEAVKDLPDPSRRAKFKTQLVKLPARLHNNGLGQTVAFYLAAGNGKSEAKPEVEICGWLEDWLRNGDGAVYRDPGDGGLIDWITGKETTFGGAAGDPALLYRHASAEARALAGWLKRFAEAFLEGDGQDG
jgi:CRISPR/Cas system CMR-associated protein Cmr5 small subunit